MLKPPHTFPRSAAYGSPPPSAAGRHPRRTARRAHAAAAARDQRHLRSRHQRRAHVGASGATPGVATCPPRRRSYTVSWSPDRCRWRAAATAAARRGVSIGTVGRERGQAAVAGRSRTVTA